MWTAFIWTVKEARLSPAPIGPRRRRCPVKSSVWTWPRPLPWALGCEEWRHPVAPPSRANPTPCVHFIPALIPRILRISRCVGDPRARIPARPWTATITLPHFVKKNPKQKKTNQTKKHSHTLEEKRGGAVKIYRLTDVKVSLMLIKRVYICKLVGCVVNKECRKM